MLKLSPSTNSRQDRTAGFTLVEALAALAIVAVSLAAIGALSNASMHSSLYVGRHLAEIETARKLVAELPPRQALTDGTHVGVLDGHNWRIDAAPYPNALPPQNASVKWRPQLIAVSVMAPTGGVVEIDTIRLRERATP